MCQLFTVSPVVTHHPYPQNVTNFEGMINLNCTATGFPSPTITWFHNNTLEDNVFSLTQAINGYTTRSVFTKSMAETNDSGVYFCRSTVDGYDDVDSDSVTVLVQGKYQCQHVITYNLTVCTMACRYSRAATELNSS